MAGSQRPNFDWASSTDITKLIALLGLGGLGGFAAAALTLPLPFLLGGLATTLLLASLANRRGITLPFPQFLRRFFVGIIGTMIGGAFSPDLIRVLPELAITAIAVAVFVPVAMAIGYVICRVIGKYDRVTALYSALPGGLIDAVEIGTASGGNAQVLTLSHLMRIFAVVFSVPLIYWAWSGGPVGSSAGESFDPGYWTYAGLALALIITLVGLAMGPLLRLPAAHLLGPMALSAILHGAGLVETASPEWLLLLAQLMVGVGLASQFSGSDGPGLARIVLTMIVMVSTLLLVSAGFALVLTRVSPLGFDALFLSFAPGGVTEMGLIALSLSVSPVVVVAHHMVRIFVVVVVAAVTARRIT